MTKYTGNYGKMIFTELVNEIIYENKIPEAWKVRTFTPIYKNLYGKDCSNCRGITQTSTHTIQNTDKKIKKSYRSRSRIRTWV